MQHIHAWFRQEFEKLEQLECLRSGGTLRRLMIGILLSYIGSQVKRRPSQSYKFKEFAKICKFLMSNETLHKTHLLKLLDKKWKYEMDPTSIGEDTERTPFCPQTDRWTKWVGGWDGGYNYLWHCIFPFVSDDGLTNATYGAKTSAGARSIQGAWIKHMLVDKFFKYGFWLAGSIANQKRC